jgi:hypothetical protein
MINDRLSAMVKQGQASRLEAAFNPAAKQLCDSKCAPRGPGVPFPAQGFVHARRLRDKRKTPLSPAGPFLFAGAA